MEAHLPRTHASGGEEGPQIPLTLVVLLAEAPRPSIFQRLRHSIVNGYFRKTQSLEG